jgi:hypothetical protein
VDANDVLIGRILRKMEEETVYGLDKNLLDRGRGKSGWEMLNSFRENLHWQITVSYETT